MSKQYTAEISVWPPRFCPVRLVLHVCTIVAFHAAVTSLWACWATASPGWIEPVRVPGGNPVIADPGLTPTSPITWVAPVFVTVLPESTPKLAAVPRLGRVAASAGAASSTSMGRNRAKVTTGRYLLSFIEVGSLSVKSSPQPVVSG